MRWRIWRDLLQKLTATSIVGVMSTKRPTRWGRFIRARLGQLKLARVKEKRIMYVKKPK